MILGLDLQTVVIGLQSTTDLAANATSKDGKYYTNAPGVPDFGAATGLLPWEVSPRSNGWTYTYDKSKVTQEQYKKYIQLLNDEGFVLTDAGVNMVGVTTLVLTKGKTDVMVTEMGDTLMIAVYQ